MNEEEQTAIALTAGNGGTFDHVQYSATPAAVTTNTQWFTTNISNTDHQHEVTLRQLAVEYAVTAVSNEPTVSVAKLDELIDYFYTFLKTGNTLATSEDNF